MESMGEGPWVEGKGRGIPLETQVTRTYENAVVLGHSDAQVGPLADRIAGKRRQLSSASKPRPSV